MDPPFPVQLKIQTKQMLIEEEVGRRKCVSYFLTSPAYMLTLNARAIKMNLANEGLEARKKDEEVAQRKRKAEDDKTWEGMFVATLLRDYR